jgi:organic hydroperoxide reductase OsmC/OhrA
MSEHRATIEWRRESAGFDYKTYNRNHLWRFGAGLEVAAAAAAENIPKTAVGAPGVDPEQAFVAALSSCHMLWFLHLACKAGYTVEGYVDKAVGVLKKDVRGRVAITRVTLRPAVSFSGKAPSAAEHDQLHHEAHEQCFIANSVTTEIGIEASVR